MVLLFLEIILTSKGFPRPRDLKAIGNEEEARRTPPSFREEVSGASALATDGASQDLESRPPLGPVGTDDSVKKVKDENENSAPEVIDPLEGMPAVDKWGIKGLRTLMNNYPDYHAMVVGMDPTSLGLDMGSQE